MRNFKFGNGEYYHIYNRGVERRNVFLCDKDYEKFLSGMMEFNNLLGYHERDYNKRKEQFKEPGSRYREPGSLNKLVDVICYCLNANHYHLVLKQNIDNGISKFMLKLNSSYTNYFNFKYHRSGHLFQGPFKAKHVDEDENLLWLAVYVNCNAQIHGLINDATKYPYSSQSEYLNLASEQLCSKETVMEQFENANDYLNFCNEIIPDIQQNKKIDKYIVE